MSNYPRRTADAVTGGARVCILPSVEEGSLKLCVQC